MKKLLSLFLALFLVTTTIPAQDSGFTFTIEFGGLWDGAEDTFDATRIRPLISYKNNNLAGGFELLAELGLWIYGLPDGFTTSYDIEFQFRGGYALGLTPDSTLSFGLGFNLMTLGLTNNRYFFNSGALLDITPDINFRHALGNVSFYARMEFPLFMSTFDFFETEMGTNILLGLDFDSGFVGFGIKTGLAAPDLRICYGFWQTLFAPRAGFNFGLPDHVESKFGFLKIMPSANFWPPLFDDPIIVQLKTFIPLFEHGMNYMGAIIIPRVETPFSPGWIAYLEVPIYGIGATFSDVVARLTLGFKVRW